MTSFLNRKQVFYLPVGLTALQKDLMEILISLHSKSFLEQYSPDSVDELANCPGEEFKRSTERLHLPPLSPLQLAYMLSSNIKAIANHPCLLVEHYMPRKLLLMQSGEDLISASDKFQKLDDLLNCIIHRDRSVFPQELKIALIAHSVKELDLIEGYLLGKHIRLKRLSGTSLFDEKHSYRDVSPESSSKDATPSGNSADCTERVSKSNGGPGYAKDDYDYSSKERRHRHEPDVGFSDNRDWLFLATTTHLTHASTLFNDYDIDMIISFDPMLYEGSASVENIRGRGKPVPIVKLLVKDSPDHYLLSHGQINDDDVEYLTSSIAHFVRHRRNIKTENYHQKLHRFTIGLLSGEATPASLPKLEHTREDGRPIVKFLNESYLKPLSHTTFKLSPVLHQLDIKSYQTFLMQMIVSRLKVCEEEYKKGQKTILSKRLRETMRQNDFDEIKAESGRVFKKFKDNEANVNDSEKRVERAKDEYEKLREYNQFLQDRKQKLEISLSNHDSKEELEINRKNLLNLRKELDSLLESNASKSKVNDLLRSQYQIKSSEAAEQALSIKTLKEAKEALIKELDGPATKLRSTSALKEDNRLQKRLARAVRQREFLQGYVDKMQQQYSLNGNSLSTTSSSKNGPHSSDSGRGGLSASSRARATRASSPTYV